MQMSTFETFFRTMRTGRRPRDPPGTRGRLGLGENNSVSLIESPFPASPVGHNETFSEINAVCQQ